MKRRIYTDTSAIGGCLDEEFQAASTQLFDRFKTGLDTLMVSEPTLTELEGAPAEVLEVLRAVPARASRKLVTAPRLESSRRSTLHLE
jgi:hypothetical protein